MNRHVLASGSLVTLTLLAAGLASSARAASFDCAKAHRGVEALICASPELSKADDVLADAYHRAHGALSLGGTAKEAKDAQKRLDKEEKEWIKRRGKCPNVDCLRTEYLARIATLRSYFPAQVAETRPATAIAPVETAPVPSPLASAPNPEPVSQEASSNPTQPSSQEAPTSSQESLSPQNTGGSAPPIPIEQHQGESLPVEQRNVASPPISPKSTIDANAIPSNHAPASNSEKQASGIQPFHVVVIGIGLLWAYCLFRGFNNHIVLYFNKTDVFVSVLGTLLLVCSLVALDPRNPHLMLGVVLLGGGVICTILTFVSSIKHNRSVINGVIVSLFKLSFAFLWFCLVFGQIGRGSDKRQSASERALQQAYALIMFVLLFALMDKLINGREVYEANGWQLPETT